MPNNNFLNDLFDNIVNNKKILERKEITCRELDSYDYDNKINLYNFIFDENTKISKGVKYIKLLIEDDQRDENIKYFFYKKIDKFLHLIKTNKDNYINNNNKKINFESSKIFNNKYCKIYIDYKFMKYFYKSFFYFVDKITQIVIKNNIKFRDLAIYIDLKQNNKKDSYKAKIKINKFINLFFSLFFYHLNDNYKYNILKKNEWDLKSIIDVEEFNIMFIEKQCSNIEKMSIFISAFKFFVYNNILDSNFNGVNNNICNMNLRISNGYFSYLYNNIGNNGIFGKFIKSKLMARCANISFQLKESWNLLFNTQNARIFLENDSRIKSRKKFKKFLCYSDDIEHTPIDFFKLAIQYPECVIDDSFLIDQKEFMFNDSINFRINFRIKIKKTPLAGLEPAT